MKKSLLLLVITTFVISGCATVRENKNYCIAAGIVAGALAGGSGDHDDEAQSAAAGAIVGGTAAWLLCRSSDADGDGISDDADRCPGTPKSAEVDSRGCALDADNDGVADYADQCPSTPSGASVDRQGCALDSDGDGVKDYMDSCPNTARGASVDSKGCELDSDGDGVVDSRDQCPNTATGKNVDNVGCNVMFSLSGVTFEYDSNNLTAAAKQALSVAVMKLNEHQDVSIAVEGHTDSVGSSEYNLRLSEKRANAVRDHLISEGISSSRISAKGHGESKPVASNDTDAGRSQNRRVDLVVVDS